MTQLILDVPDFQKFLHPEVPERIPLKLMKTEMIIDQLKLRKFDQKVRLIDSLSIVNEGIDDYIQIKLEDIEKDSIIFGLYHKIEGAQMWGYLIKRNDIWNISVTGIGEE